jgi:hypothetical protein
MVRDDFTARTTAANDNNKGQEKGVDGAFMSNLSKYSLGHWT